MFLAIQSHTDCREAQATLSRGQARLGWTLPFPKLASSLVFVLRIQTCQVAWFQVESGPAERYSHASAMEGGRFWVFGGA